MKILFCCALMSLPFVRCQNSKYSQTEILAYQIARESCKDLSQITTGIVGGFISGLINVATSGILNDVNTGNLGAIPEYWCDCFTYYAVTDLSKNFTKAELAEIREDPIKKFLVLEKLIEKRHLEIQDCIETGTQQITEDYFRFTIDLEDKLKNSNR